MARQSLGTLRTLERSGTDPSFNRSQIDQLNLNFAKQRFGDVLSLYRNAFNRPGTGTTVPGQFSEAVDLYRPGGQFGLGTERAIETGTQREIARGNISSAMSGLGTSTTALARTSAATRSARDARLLANENRLRLLGGALGQAGQAGLEAQRIDAARQESLLRSLASLS